MEMVEWNLCSIYALIIPDSNIERMNKFALYFSEYNNNNNDRLTAFDPGQPG